MKQSQRDPGTVLATSMVAVVAVLIVMLGASNAIGQAGVLFVEGNFVGIGTATPQVPLHIDSSGGESNVVRLVRDGVLRYRLENTAVGASWDFNNDANGNFAVSRVGTGKSELSLTGAAKLGLGCNGADHDFVISPGPACTATPRSWINAGDTSFSTTSSKTFKENLRLVETTGVLEKIRDIPVYEYDFIDGPKDRMGLMAEDFHQVFERGSDKEISGQEMTMALWLAVQELSAELEALKESQAKACGPSEGGS